jgi:hypothetical protein
MKKLFLFSFIVGFMLLFSTMSFALSAEVKTVDYYDVDGNKVVINGMYYNIQGYPMFNASCYYLDAEGNPVFVGGCRAYYNNAKGEIVPGNYYYDAEGNAVQRPTSYPGGWGCGTYCYNTQGDIEEGAYYYDDFGNPVDPPVAQSPPVSQASRCGGCCR